MLNENEKIILRSLHNVGIEHSDDPDTKVGVVLFAENNERVEVANELPLGISNFLTRVTRPGKYDWIAHGEATAIAEAARLGLSTQGGIMFMRWFPCYECAKLIINSGIGELYCQPHTVEDPTKYPRYKFDIAQEMLNESSVKIIPWTDEDI
jgi:dCMP deaminase